MSETVEVGQMRRLPGGEVCEVVEIYLGAPESTALIETVMEGGVVNVPWLAKYSVLVNPAGEEGR